MWPNTLAKSDSPLTGRKSVYSKYQFHCNFPNCKAAGSSSVFEPHPPQCLETNTGNFIQILPRNWSDFLPQMMLIICVRLRLHLIEDNISLLCIFVATTLLLHQHSRCSHSLHCTDDCPINLCLLKTKIFSKCFVSSSLDRYLGNFDRKLNKKRQVQFYNGNVAPLKFLINIIKTSWTVECWPFLRVGLVTTRTSLHVALLILMNSTAQYSPLIMEPASFLPPRKPSSLTPERREPSLACYTSTC